MFSADQLIIQNWKVDFSITKPRGYYIVPTLSTALQKMHRSHALNELLMNGFNLQILNTHITLFASEVL